MKTDTTDLVRDLSFTTTMQSEQKSLGTTDSHHTHTLGLCHTVNFSSQPELQFGLLTPQLKVSDGFDEVSSPW